MISSKSYQIVGNHGYCKGGCIAHFLLGMYIFLQIKNSLPKCISLYSIIEQNETKSQFHSAIDDEDFKSIIKVVKNIGHKKHKL